MTMATQGRRKVVTRQANCACCGVPFLAQKRGLDWSVYCGRKCYGKSRTLKARKTMDRLRVVVVSYHGHCEGCGRHYRKAAPQQQYCSETCRPVEYQWVPEVRQCVGCGATFTQVEKWQRRCSSGCVTEAERAQKRRAKARRRAICRGAAADQIDPLAVFRRDKYRCHMCGCKTRAEARGTCDPLAPELDHLVSLADGGQHTWGNVACACRSCNGEKGAASRGQLLLPIAA